MPGSKCLTFMPVFLCLLLNAAKPEYLFAEDKKLSAEEVVAKHLLALGKPDALNNVKGRAFKGTASFKFIQGATGTGSNGVAVFASETNRTALKLQYNDLNYPGEYFAYNGEDVSVGHISPGQKSPLADFIYRYGAVMKEGLLGGTWSLSWPLLDIQKRQPQLKYKSVKDGGRKLHELEYRTQKGLGDLKVKIFLDFETYRHVKTEYRVRIRDDNSTRSAAGERRRGTGISRYDTQGASEINDDVPDSTYLLIEKFEDFIERDGVMLPTVCAYEYSIDGQGNSFLAHWAIRADGAFAHNGKIPDDFFVAQK